MSEFLVRDEVGTLKTVAVFGPPGIESYLAQFWPKDESLFYGNFDVEKAQQEYSGLVKILEGEGIKVLDLKKAYASTLPSPSLSPKQLIEELSKKVPRAEPSILERLLEKDIRAYGRDNAIALNMALSYDPPIPMGNIYFARDQSNVFLDTCILGNMASNTRKPEVDIIRKALESLGYNNFYQVQNGVFEGGDGMIINGAAYIGSGTRTTPEAVKEIADFLRIPTFMVEIYVNGEWGPDMETMHLDTFFMPLTPSKVIGCKYLLNKCMIRDLKSGKRMNFLDYLEDNFEVLDIPHEEQKTYAANMLVIAPGKVVIPSDYNRETAKRLIDNGIETVNARLTELTQGFGATHCMVLQLEKYRRDIDYKMTF